MNHMPYPRRTAPPMYHVTQYLPSQHIEDPGGAVHQQLLEKGLRERIKPGAKIGITAGSRDMGGFIEILTGIVAAVRDAGGEPFLLPAMGSHGGATPEGQSELLRILGADRVPAPIRATMDTVPLGSTPNGAVAHLDCLAHEADGVIVFGRTMTHPESNSGLASGLLKMVTVGLGKQVGAQSAHNHGLWDSIRQVPQLTIPRAKILFGVAVLHNGYQQPMTIEVVEPHYEAFLESDQRLLGISRAHVPDLPYEHLDLLVVDELGKTVSGTGMDLNVIGKWRMSNGPAIPNYHRIVVLSLTRGSMGNGLGIGMADFTTSRFIEAYDPAASYINLLTATEPGGTTREGPLPLALETDQEAIEVGLYSSLAPETPRICRIKNTTALWEFEISEALCAESGFRANLQVDPAAAPWPYDSDGNLL